MSFFCIASLEVGGEMAPCGLPGTQNGPKKQALENDCSYRRAPYLEAFLAWLMMPKLTLIKTYKDQSTQANPPPPLPPPRPPPTVPAKVPDALRREIRVCNGFCVFFSRLTKRSVKMRGIFCVFDLFSGENGKKSV